MAQRQARKTLWMPRKNKGFQGAHADNAGAVVGHIKQAAAARPWGCHGYERWPSDLMRIASQHAATGDARSCDDGWISET